MSENLVGRTDTPNRELDHATMLLQAQRDVDIGLDIQDVLARVLRIAVNAVGARDGTLLLLDDGGTLCFRARFGRSLPAGKPERCFRLGEGVAGHVLETGMPYI